MSHSALPDTESSSDSIKPTDWGLLLLLTFLNVLNMVDRQLLASFSNYIVPDLSLTNTEFGLLTGLVFLFFYYIHNHCFFFNSTGVCYDNCRRSTFWLACFLYDYNCSNIYCYNFKLIVLRIDYNLSL